MDKLLLAIFLISLSLGIKCAEVLNITSENLSQILANVSDSRSGLLLGFIKSIFNQI